MKTASNAGALEGLLGVVLGPGGHQTGHLVLRQLNLAAPEGGEVDVGNLVGLRGLTHCECGGVSVGIEGMEG